MLGVHWFWADFLLSPAARNFFFSADRWSYGDRLGDWRYQFWTLDRDARGWFSPWLLAKGIAIAIAVSMVASRISLALGNGMARVKR
jgi:hypothetical protein